MVRRSQEFIEKGDGKNSSPLFRNSSRRATTRISHIAQKLIKKGNTIVMSSYGKWEESKI
jgi:hypothetical protein